MTATPTRPVRRRRYGKQLETALLAAGWDELVTTGYANLTMESVAQRAQTSIAVLYRRWANKDELALAAIEHFRDAHPIVPPDTGTLRGDLLAQLTATSKARAGMFAIAAAAGFSGLLVNIGLSPSQYCDKVMHAKSHRRIRAIYQQAHDRGEIDLKHIPPAVLEMPFDLVRHDLLMDLKPATPSRIRTIVDDLFLPLVQAHSG